MFPGRYFPSRYFPDRYFGKAGAEPTGAFGAVRGRVRVVTDRAAAVEISDRAAGRVRACNGLSGLRPIGGGS